MGFSDPVDLPEHGESGLVFVLIFEILKLYLVAQCEGVSCVVTSPLGGVWLDALPLNCL